MTTNEARQVFGLSENDELYTEGILRLIKVAQERLGTWSLSGNNRKVVENELNALLVLDAESIK